MILASGLPTTITFVLMLPFLWLLAYAFLGGDER